MKFRILFFLFLILPGVYPFLDSFAEISEVPSCKIGVFVSDRIQCYIEESPPCKAPSQEKNGLCIVEKIDICEKENVLKDGECIPNTGNFKVDDPSFSGQSLKNENSDLIFNSKNGTGLVMLKKGQETDVIFNYEFRNNQIFDGYVYYNIAEAGQLIHNSQNFTISEIPKTFKFSYTPQNVGIFSFTKGAISHTGIPFGEQTQFIAVVEKFSKAQKFNGQCKKPFPEFNFVIKPDFSTVACVKIDTKEILKKRGWH